ncbi:MAG TPA: ACT domain-containing protein [Vicinamibacterales bacterium]|nr:ACT domain-containing protein [Vicinamibacterales bacterium]
MQLLVLRGELAVARLNPTDPIPDWVTPAPISSITRTRDELSIVCEAASVPAAVRAERGWRCLRVAGSLDFSLTGVLASIAAPLANAGVSIFAISTYETDYVLVREPSVAAAIDCLAAAGHEVAAG